VTAEVEREGRLTLQDVLDAAVRVAERTGFDRLTMRAVAEELNVTTMAPYYYVKNKHELLVSLSEAVLSQVEIPAPDAGDWEFRLRALHRAVSENRRANPRTVALNLDLELTPSARRMIQAGQEILADAGLSPEGTDKAAVMWHLYGLGRVALSAGTWSKARTGRGRRANGEATPRGRARVEQMTSPEYEEYAIDLFIAGVHAMKEVERARGPISGPTKSAARKSAARKSNSTKSTVTKSAAAKSATAKSATAKSATAKSAAARSSVSSRATRATRSSL
jgi:TetR/AcrR family transcriptional regulator, tetracycline repressor protein